MFKHLLSLVWGGILWGIMPWVCADTECPPLDPDHVRIRALTPEILAVSLADGPYLNAHYTAEFATPFNAQVTGPHALRNWKRDQLFRQYTDSIIQKYRNTIATQCATGAWHLNTEKIETLSYFPVALSQARFTNENGEEERCAQANIAHHTFLKVSHPLTNGTHTIVFPWGQKISFSYNENTRCSPLFKFDQLGFSPRAGEKYAYIGAWLGPAGALDLSAWIKQKFYVVKTSDSAIVFEGMLQERVADPTYKKTPYTGEQTLELDFSKFNTPGRYVLRVDKLGESSPFEISEGTIGEAFYIHARGLYHKRCGIAKAEPFTAWHSDTCHTVTWQGTFPPNDRHYSAAPQKIARDFGFFNENGESVNVSQFRLIQQNAPRPPCEVAVRGGWHDAADYDRRPYHFAVVNQLLTAYLLFPENFTDSQLNIPESGNGLPDILDEALYAMEFWRSAQKASGGVGTWVESTRHPTCDDPAKDPNPFYLSLETCESTLEYAAYAALTATALKKAGDPSRAEIFTRSAERAFAYATNPRNRATHTYEYCPGKDTHHLEYRESATLPDDLFLKASVNLFVLTGNVDYIEPISANQKKYEKLFETLSWKYHPWMFAEFSIFKMEEIKLPKLCSAYDKAIMKNADFWRNAQNQNYPYRIPWYAANHPYTSHMSWGNVHPFKRAAFFILAWKLSGRAEYRDAAFLACNWANGGNPLGLSMTSRIGHTYPLAFLDHPSYADGIAEFVPGITPYMFTFGIEPNDRKWVHKAPLFTGDIQTIWPIWRRFVNLEAYSVANSEYTVTETIGPAVGVCGALLAPGWTPPSKLLNMRPLLHLEKSEGYLPLP